MKKVLSVLLTLAMIFSLIPMGTFTLTANAYTFTCTDGYYTYTVTDGKATITDIETFLFDGDVAIPSRVEGYPVISIGNYAFEDCTGLTSVIIPYSITSIGEGAFSYCTGLTSITIPNSVTYIGNGAFSSCTGLTSITIPDSVTSIGFGIFDACWNLATVKLPNGITSIESDMFIFCSSLTSITIPDSVKDIDHYAFGYTGLTSITIPDSVTWIGNNAFVGCENLAEVWYSGTKADREKIVIEENNNYLLNATWHYGKSGDENHYAYTVTDGKARIIDVDTAISGDITIPSTLGGYTVTSIGRHAFENCTALTSITIGNSVTNISQSAFENCTGLTSITVNSGNTVYHSAGNCLINTESKTVILGCINSVIPNDGSVTSIGDQAFYNCTRLTSITIPDSITNIGYYAFYNCTALTSITIGDSVTSIGDWAFYGCTGLTSITIPDSVTSIGSMAFYDTGYYNNEDNWEDDVLYIGNHLIEAKYSKTGAYTIKDRTLTIADCAFEECTGLTSITIPDSVTSIGSYAFYYCTGLTSITIPDTVTSIGGVAFYNCTGLTSITIPDSITNIGYYAFYNCTALTSIIIPDGVTNIGEGAFEDCWNLTDITIPNSVTSIGDYAFEECESLIDVWYSGSEEDAENISFAYGNDYLLDATWHYDEAPEEKYYTYTITDDKATITAVDTSISGDVTIPSTLGGYPVIGIDRSAFEGCLSITSIAVPDGVTTISEYAFFDCQAMTSITLPDSITSIGNYAFLDTGYYLNEDNWEDNVLYIGKHLIKANSSIIDDCIVKDGTLTIADYAFAFREELTGIVISNSVKNIGECAFGGCAALESITVDSGNTVFHSEGNCLIDTENKVLVAGCKNSNIPTDDSVTSIGDYAFYGNYEVTNITIPENITSIGWCSFAECGALAKIIIPDSITSIGEGAFEECASLTDVWYGGSMSDREKLDLADGNDYLIGSTWHYDFCKEHTYIGFFDRSCDSCGWERDDRSVPTSAHLLEMQQNMLGITNFPYGYFDINLDEYFNATDLVILQMFILGL